MAYDLSEAFEAIEDELISSMMRNLKQHQAEESRLGFEWEQWQALQLRALEDYRRRNMKKFPPRFNKLNLQIDEMLKRTYNDGRTAQERKILQAIQMGFKPSKMPYSGDMELEGSFFGVNDRKLDALINAVDNDMSRAEYAVLRRADDQYRQVIFNAQVYANTGAGTYQKAVDMATRDFLRAGLDCVEYKDGSRHTLEDYADMAIRTANKRAYLQGEGSMRDEWGIPTVIMNKRSCPCPRCAPFVGKVFIDDVWSGGQAYINGENKQKDENAVAYGGMLTGKSPVTGIEYPLLSEAIRQGLYHPRCKDVHSTYFEGITTPPEGSQYTADELDEMAQKYEAQQKQGYCERQEKRYSRMSKYSLDEENQRMYGARAKQWSEKAETFGNVINSFEKPVEKSEKSGIISTEELQSFKNGMLKLGIDDLQGFEEYKGEPRVLHEMIEDFAVLKENFSKLFSGFKGISYFEQNADEYASYNPITKMFNFNPRIYNNTEVLKSVYENDVRLRLHPKGTSYRANVFHEFGHYIESVAEIDPKKIAKAVYQKQSGRYFTRKMGDDWIAQNLSVYATDGDYDEFIAECFAEFFESENSRNISVDTMDEIVSILFKKGLV